MDLNDFDIPARVLPAQYSKTEALVGIGQKELKRISVPKDTKLTLHLVSIDYLHSIKFKGLAVLSRQNQVRGILLLFKFIAHNNYQSDRDVPQDVFAEFLQYVIKNSSQKGNTVGATVKYSKSPIDWYLSEIEKVNDRNNYCDQLRLYLAHFPNFERSPTNPYPPLSEMFPNCPYSDTEIVKSLRLICCWTLLEHKRQREVILLNSEINDLVTRLKKRNITAPPVSFGVFSGVKKELNDECRALYYPLVKFVSNSNDLVLMERLIQSLRHPFKPSTSLDEMQLIFKKVLQLDERVSKEFKYKGKKYQQPSIRSIVYRDLFAPSLVEVFAAQCFLASDRVQTSNLERLKLTDVTNNDRGFQAEHVKGRRNKRHQKGITSVYPPEELIHDAIDGYFDTLKSCQPILPQKAQGVAFPYLYQTHLKYGQLGKNDDVLTSFFSLLITDGTHTRADLIKDITEKDAMPFLWVISKIIENNKLAQKQERAYSNLKKDKEKQDKICRKDIVSMKIASLNPTYIGQSRVAMDGGINVSLKGAEDHSGFSDSRVEAQLTGQTPKTKHNTYHDRSNAREVIESRRKFPVQVGDLMQKDALKIGELMKNTQIVDFEEAKKLLGCANASEDFKSLINELDVDIGLTSEIITDDKTIFVENELTAALIILKMLHIEQHLPRMLMDDPDSQAKAKRAIGEKVYLQAVLDRFSKDIQVAGKAMSKNLTFSFSDLI